MPFPTILVDSTNGAASDTACSGAGPTTALTGTAAASDGAGTTITLDAGTVLTGVDTTGLHALYFADTTAGHRRFAAITGTAGSGGATPTVTLREAVTISLSGKSWAIGGVRATIGGAVSTLLFDNNSAAGDAMPGWVEEMQSGHTETIAAQFNMRRAGDQTSGPITLRGAIGAATLPVVTFNNAGNAMAPRVSFVVLQGFELRNTNASATNAIIPAVSGLDDVRIVGMKVANSGNKFTTGVNTNGINGIDILDSEFAFASTANISINTNSSRISIESCSIHDGVSHGVIVASGSGTIGLRLINCQLTNNGGDGLNDAGTGLAPASQHLMVWGCTFDKNTGDGIEISTAIATSIAPYALANITNNIFSNNSGYGVNLSGTGVTDAAMAGCLFKLRNNNFFNNTSGKYNGITVATSINEVTVDPQYANAAAGDFTPKNWALRVAYSTHPGS